MTAPLEVAIVGGGIAGCTLAVGLLQYSHLHCDVFEARPTFTERGASVGLAANAVNALRHMGLDADKMMYDTGAVLMNRTQYLAAMGEHKGKELFQLPSGVISVMRSRWLEELLRPLPKNSLHPDKKLISISQPAHDGDKYVLSFADGTSHHADVIIGCDGIRSMVRDSILGSENRAIFGRYWDACARLSPKRAAELFGTDIFDPFDAVEVALIGEGASMLFVPNSGGEVYNVIVAAEAQVNDTTPWKLELTRAFVEEVFSGWDAEFRTKIIDLLLDPSAGAGVIYTQWESPVAETYYRDRLCIIGDSAHATIPWLGQGACMAMEDAAVLTNLLGMAHTVSDISIALDAFDRTRRGRPEYIMSQSREAAKVLTGRRSLDPCRLRALNVPSWWEEIWAFDMAAHIQEARKHFDTLRGCPTEQVHM